MKLNDKLFCSPLAIADAFNNYFSSVTEKLLTPLGNPLLITKIFYLNYIRIFITYFQR
jgi:hypothetical protein